jgi:hypothetical protein
MIYKGRTALGAIFERFFEQLDRAGYLVEAT